jgi:hypothetical protein
VHGGGENNTQHNEFGANRTWHVRARWAVPLSREHLTYTSRTRTSTPKIPTQTSARVRYRHWRVFRTHKCYCSTRAGARRRWCKAHARVNVTHAPLATTEKGGIFSCAFPFLTAAYTRRAILTCSSRTGSPAASKGAWARVLPPADGDLCFR